MASIRDILRFGSVLVSTSPSRNLLVVSLLALTLANAGCNLSIEPQPIHDPRACAGSNLSLADALGTFQLQLPADTEDLRYQANSGPMGDEDLTLLFRTSPAGLNAFLAGSHVPTLSSRAQQMVNSNPGCQLAGYAGYSKTVNDTTSIRGTWRCFATDDTVPASPRVLVVASTL